MNQKHMHAAIEAASKGMKTKGGGPFGAVVVRDQQIVGAGHNCVTATNDPTAHAEMVAIREACQSLNTFQLPGCELYSTCEPCPMCLGAIYWARLDRLYYACTKEDAAKAGFDDAFIYEEIDLHPTQNPISNTPEIPIPAPYHSLIPSS